MKKEPEPGQLLTIAASSEFNETIKKGQICIFLKIDEQEVWNHRIYQIYKIETEEYTVYSHSWFEETLCDEDDICKDCANIRKKISVETCAD